MKQDRSLILAPPQERPPKGFWTKVRATVGRAPMVDDALAAWYCATDPVTPTHAKAVIFGALAYFVAPIDLIPDVIVSLGFTDDAAVLGAAVAMVQKYMRAEHMEKARAWLGTNIPKTDT